MYPKAMAGGGCVSTGLMAMGGCDPVKAETVASLSAYVLDRLRVAAHRLCVLDSRLMSLPINPGGADKAAEHDILSTLNMAATEADRVFGLIEAIEQKVGG